MLPAFALVAQLDKALASGAKDCEFESRREHLRKRSSMSIEHLRLSCFPKFFSPFFGAYMLVEKDKDDMVWGVYPANELLPSKDNRIAYVISNKVDSASPIHRESNFYNIAGVDDAGQIYAGEPNQYGNADADVLLRMKAKIEKKGRSNPLPTNPLPTNPRIQNQLLALRAPMARI